MNTDRVRSVSRFLPACAVVLIICGFSYGLHLRSGQGSLQAAPALLSKTRTLDLVGVVKSVDGRPLQNASVFIYTAQPRSGPGFL